MSAPGLQIQMDKEALQRAINEKIQAAVEEMASGVIGEAVRQAVTEIDTGVPKHDLSGVERIARERRRQVTEEGYSDPHDDEHDSGDLANAAASYAWLAALQSLSPHHDWAEIRADRPPSYWPWAKEDWKPAANPIRNLEKAGALIAAEIDRLLRQGGAELRGGHAMSESELPEVSP